MIHIFFLLMLLNIPVTVPKYESGAMTFARVEKNGNIPPWKEPEVLPGNRNR